MWVKFRGDGSTAANWSNSVSAKEENKEGEIRTGKVGIKSTIGNQEGNLVKQILAAVHAGVVEKNIYSL